MPAAHKDESGFEGYVARFTRALESGEIRVPAPRPQQQAWFCVAGTDDPAVLQPQALEQYGPLDERAPEAILAAQASGFAADPAVIEAMSDNALLGLAGAGRRLAARAAAIQQRAVAAYASRHTPAPGSKASRHGFTEFSADELSWSLVINHNQAEAAMVTAKNAGDRLPGCPAARLPGCPVGRHDQRVPDADHHRRHQQPDR
jgi:hypothetical protein